MAVPKRKTGKQKTRQRRASAWRITPCAKSLWPHCHQTKLPHIVCPNSGRYHGPQAVEVE
jgi:large subunit ribosomal protein L32